MALMRSDSSRSLSLADLLRHMAKAIDAPGVAAAPSAKPPEPPEFRSAGEILRSVTSGPEWLWHPYLAAGHRSLLVGKAKAGKSTMLFGLLGAMERGQPFLDRPTTRTRAVVLTEEGESSVREKAGRFDLRDTECLLCDSLGRYSFAEALEYAVERAVAIGARLIVVDTYAAWARLPKEGENDAGVVLAAMEPVSKACSRGLAVLLIHHANKAGTTVDDAVRGSTALNGAVDVVALLSGGGKGSRTRRTLDLRSRFEGSPDALLFEYRHGEFRAIGTLAALAQQRDEARILATLAGTPGRRMTEDELLLAASMKRQSGKRALRALERTGRIYVSGGGKRGDPKRYSLMPPPTPDDESVAA